jgi:hypothetical protein
MTRLLALILLSGVGLGFAGCASDPNPSADDRVSTIPWNRPERWEGQGALGGFGTQ